MEAFIIEWLSLFLRWFHLLVGIAWIGNSLYFVWLDNHIQPPKQANSEVEGELWMVHSGGFYQVEKRKPGPGGIPDVLHWFKWEATLTWVSGFLLLIVIYYMSNGMYLIDPNVRAITPVAATLFGVGLLFFSWFIYDAVWRFLNSKTAMIFSILLMFTLVYLVTHVLSGRAAFIHVGAVFGTIMVLNVWIHILPAQTEMIDATKRGEMPDFTLGKKAKLRSMHNSYLTLPVLFIMLSNHYPMTYAVTNNGFILIALIIFGAGIRHWMIKGKIQLWAGIILISSIVTAFYLTLPKSMVDSNKPYNETPILFTQVQEVINKHCLSCHSHQPTNLSFGGVAAGGVELDTASQVEQYKDRIYAVTIETAMMPLGNMSNMTQEERGLLSQWIQRQ